MDLVGYLSSGYPSKEEILKNAATYIEAGCDVLEIDLPIDNPYIDGKLIQHRMISSYNNDPTLQSQVAVIKEIRKLYPKQRIFLLAYEKTILDFGIEKFIELYRSVKAEALILVAMRDDIVKNELVTNHVKIVNYIQYNLPEEEVQVAKNTNSFIYLQSKPENEKLSKNRSLKEVIDYLKEEEGIQVPIYCGVGVSTPEDIQRIKKAGGSGAFVGSGLLKREEDKETLIKYIQQLKQATH